MTKKGIAALLLVVLLCFSSCSTETNEKVGDLINAAFKAFGYKTEREISHEIFDVLLIGLHKRDEDLIRSVYSKNVLEETDNLEESFSELWDFFQGDILSYDDFPGLIESDGCYDHGNKWIDLEGCYTINTSVRSYFITFKTRKIDTFDSGTEGLRSLYIVNDETWDGEEGVYHGDGNWTLGLIIDKTTVNPETFYKSDYVLPKHIVPFDGQK